MSSQTPIPSNNLQSAMSDQINIDVEVSPEQNKYASILLFCSWAGIIVMVITFLIYMAGFLNPIIKPSDMPLYWGMSVHQYSQATNAPAGWNWLSLITHADYLNLVGLAFLGVVSVLGYLSLLVTYLRKKDFPYATMVGLEIIIIVLAASGVFQITE